MHEIGVVRQVLRTVENFAKENGLDRIDTIVLEIGDLSLVIPKYVEDIYNVIIKDTPFEFTKLKIEVVEAMASAGLQKGLPHSQERGYCPRCGKRNADVISGRDFLVKEVIDSLRGGHFAAVFTFFVRSTCMLLCGIPA